MLWNEEAWKSNETWLEEIEQNIIKLKARVKRGGNFDTWDIKTRNGLFSTAKGILTVEEHGANKQYVKFKYWADYSISGLLLIAGLVTITALAAIDQSWIAAGMLFLFTAIVVFKYVLDCASVVNCMVTGFKKLSFVEQKNKNLNLVHSKSEVKEASDFQQNIEIETEAETVGLKPLYSLKDIGSRNY